MTIPSSVVKENFKVVGVQMLGSNVATILNYDKFKTKTLPPVILQISNTSPEFAIEFYPTGSCAVGTPTRMIYSTLDNPPRIINQQFPYRLPSGSITVQVNVNTYNFDNAADNTNQVCDVKFNLVAVTSSFVSIPVAAGQPLPTVPPGTGQVQRVGLGQTCNYVSIQCLDGLTCQFTQLNNGNYGSICRPEPVCTCTENKCSEDCPNAGQYCDGNVSGYCL